MLASLLPSLDRTQCAFSGAVASIENLSDWHIKKIRTECPDWTDFYKFITLLFNGSLNPVFEEYRPLSKGYSELSEHEIERLMDQIYPEWMYGCGIVKDNTLNWDIKEVAINSETFWKSIQNTLDLEDGKPLRIQGEPTEYTNDLQDF
tara:strand:- start:8793 stop:9236 length:444 start_codon:yes stop_codon:yes gene_type:complete